MRRAVKTNNAKKFAHKALAVSLALAMAVSPLQMAGSVKAYAADGRLPAGTVELKSTTLTDAHFYGEFTTPNAVVNNGAFYTMSITTEEGYILTNSFSDDRVVKIIDLGDANGHATMTLLSKSGDKLAASDWQEILRKIHYTKTAENTDMTVKISLDSNETNITKHITNFEVENVALTEYDGHYYMFVDPAKQEKLGVHYKDGVTPYSSSSHDHISWSEAYNQAKGFMLNGMKGYLVTIESAEELDVLHSISDRGAWTGGTALVANGTNAKIDDPDSINRQTETYVLDLVNTIQHNDLDRANQGNSEHVKYHGSDCPAGCEVTWDTDYNKEVQESVFDDYYWACGPNAGTLITKSVWQNKGTTTEPNHMYENLHSERQSITNVPFENCVMANRENKSVINDLVEWNSCHEDVTYHAIGYFVEFGGYANEDPLVNASMDPTTTTTKLISNKIINVTENIDHATITDPTTGKKGEEYTTTVTPEIGYKIPETITVTVGGNTLTPNVDYVYDNTTGEVTVKEHAVTGDITIEGTADAIPGTYPVINSVSHTTPKDPKPATPDKTYEITLTPEEGYKLPETVTVKVDGVEVPEATYDPKTGLVSVPETKVTGEIEIEGSAIPTSYPVTNNVTNTEPKKPEPATPGVEYKVTLTPEDGYKIPDTVTVTVTVDGTPTPIADAYDPKTGTVTVPADKVTGPIAIEGKAIPTSYPVTNNVTNTEPKKPEPATPGVEYNVTLTPEDGYKLPDDVKVTVDGTEIPNAYDPATGTVTVPADKVTGAIAIEGEATPDSGDFTVTNNVPFTTNGKTLTPAKPNESYEVFLTPVDGKELPDEVKVTVSGKELIPETDFNYHKDSGQVDIHADKVTGPIVIASANPTEYDVKNNIANTTPETPEKATEGVDYDTKLVPNEGYKLPETVTVTVNGADVPEATYDPTTGKVTVPADKVTGPIAIEGTAPKKPATYDVTNKVDNTTPTTPEKATEGTPYETKLVPNDGYKLPETVTVKVGDKTLDPKEFTYDPTTGTVTVPADKVTGPIAIEGTAPKKPATYDVTNNIANTTPATPEKATEKAPYETKLVPNEGYKLPETVTVTVAGKPVPEATYDPTTGTVTVPADKVTGSIAIEGTAPRKPATYDVTNKVDHTTPTTPEKATEKAPYETKLVPEDGYKLPETVTVKVGDKTLDPKDFTYDPETGKVTVPADKVTGPIAIEGSATPNPDTYPVKNGVTNTEPTKPEPAKKGEDYKVKLTPEENYKLPETVTVKVGDKPLDPTEFTYNPETGEVTIPKDKITGPIDIEGNAIPTAYPVANKVDNTTPAKPEAATPDKKYEVTLTPDAGYKLPETVTVKVNDVPLTDGYFYDPADGKLTITAAKVNGPIAIEGKADLLPGRVPVENNVKNTEPTKPEPAKEGEDYKVTLTPEDGYKLPDDVKVKVDGKELDPKDYEYDPKTGEVTIPKEKVTGPIEIEGTATPVPKTPLNDKDVPNKPADNVDITFDPENPANTGLQIADDGSIKPMPYDGKEKKPVPTIKVDGKELVPGKDYDVTYDDNTDAGLGKMTITGKGDYTGTLTKDIPIEKAVPKINVPETSDLDLGEPVNNSTLTGGNGIGVDGKPLPGKFAWSSTDPLTKDNAGKKVHYVTFTPDDTKNYSPVTFTVAVNEKKPGADPAPNPAPGELPAPIEYNGQTAQPMPTGNEGDPKYDAAVKKMLDDEGEYGSNLPILLAKGKDTSKGKKEKMNLSWLKFDGAEGYMIYWNYCDGTRNYKLLTTVKGVNKLKYVDKKINEKKLKNKYKSFKYYVIAYKTINGQKCAIAKSPTIHVAMTKYDKKYTNAKTVTIKKGKKTIKSLSLKNGKSAKIKGVSTKENNKKKMLNHDKGMRYYSSNKKVAKVGRTTGKVIATGKGKCKIYAIACNGNRKDIKVTVK